MKHIITFILTFTIFIGEAAAAGTSKYAFTLDDCLKFALQNNFDIKTANESIKRQIAVKKEATSRLLPSVTVSTTANRIDDELLKKLAPSGSQVVDRTWDANVTATQTVFAGGRNVALLQKESLMQKSLEKKLQWITENTVFAVKSNFYAALLARSQMEVQEQLVELLSKELVSQTNKFQAGIVPEFNVLRAEVSLANSKAPLIRAQNSYRLAIEELRRVLGLSEAETERQTLLDINGEFENRQYDIDLDYALELAHGNRAELEELQAAIAAQRKVVWAARTEYLPQVNAFAKYGMQNKYGANRYYDDSAEGWAVGATASWNVFNGFGTDARVEQAIATRNILTTAKSNQTLSIEVEVRRAYSTLLEAKALLEASIKVTEQAEESVRLAKSAVDAGTGIQLDVLQSQYDLTDARNNKIRALYDYNMAIARLERAIGRM